MITFSKLWLKQARSSLPTLRRFERKGFVIHRRLLFVWSFPASFSITLVIIVIIFTDNRNHFRHYHTHEHYHNPHRHHHFRQSSPRFPLLRPDPHLTILLTHHQHLATKNKPISIISYRQQHIIYKYICFEITWFPHSLQD